MDRPPRAAQIMDEALNVFATKGYTAASLGEIAAASGIMRSSLYEYFGSKRELYLAVLQEQTEAAIAFVGPLVTGSGSTETRIQASVEAYFSYVECHPAAARLLFDRSREGDAEIRDLRHAVRLSGVETVRELLERDLVRADIPAGPPLASAVVEIIISALDGATRWWERHPETPRAELVSTVVATLATGFSRPAAPV